MHPNPTFRKTSETKNIAFAQNRSFGQLVLNGDTTPMIAHIPFLLSDDGSQAELHLVRSNPIARAIGESRPATLIVSGPDGYISPDWYGVVDQVPTWNYVAVHLTGTLSALPQENLLDILQRQSDLFENQLLPKTPWTPDKMTPDVLEKMQRQIRPFRLQIETIESTWKLSQNKPDDVRANAAKGVEDASMRADSELLAEMMRAL